MPRWNNSLEDNCKFVLDNTIKNIHPIMYQTILSDVISSNQENNKKMIEQYIRSKLDITSNLSRKTKQYWILRGWSHNESYIKAKENKQKNSKSVFSREFWLEKCNPITGINYTIDEADFERNSRRPIRKEYWIKKGHTDQEAQALALDCKNNNNKLGAKSSSASTVRNITSKRCTEYYTVRGYTVEEAKNLISEQQKYFSKEICIRKYGEKKGLEVWRDRQNRWQNTLSAKSDEEKSRINRLKLSKGITISKAEKIILEQIKNIFPSVKHQFTLANTSNKKQYVYDINVEKKIIEYNGDFWHANPSKYSADFINPRTKLKSCEKWELDAIKIKYAESQGYKVLVVWESDFKLNKEKVIKECIQFLTQ